MRDLRTLIDDEEVTLAFYGSIVYLAVVSALGSQAEPVRPLAAISTLAATATVLFVAHVFSALVPRSARAGRLHLSELTSAFRHDAPLLACAIVPATPLVLAAWEMVAVDRGYRLSVRLTIAMLFGLAVMLSRRDGLSWVRAVVAGLVIIALASGVIWLESRVH
jgi:hypothetical protein